MSRIEVGSLVAFDFFDRDGHTHEKNAVGVVRKETETDAAFWVEVRYPFSSRGTQIAVRKESMIFLMQLQPVSAAVVDLCLYEGILRLAQKIDQAKPSHANLALMCQT